MPCGPTAGKSSTTSDQQKSERQRSGFFCKNTMLKVEFAENIKKNRWRVVSCLLISQQHAMLSRAFLPAMGGLAVLSTHPGPGRSQGTVPGRSHPGATSRRWDLHSGLTLDEGRSEHLCFAPKVVSGGRLGKCRGPSWNSDLLQNPLLPRTRDPRTFSR